jgi:uncharacterized protein (DUF2126 family)
MRGESTARQATNPHTMGIVTSGKKGGGRRGRGSDPAGIAERVEEILVRHGVEKTIGAEPTCVPIDPRGAEWNFAATGPTKLVHAHNLAVALVEQSMPGALILFAPGKSYPGEVNPRWALHVVGRRDGKPLVRRRAGSRRATGRDAVALLRRLAARLGVRPNIIGLPDPLLDGGVTRVLPLDGDGRNWISPTWEFPAGAEMLRAEGPAGLRLPLGLLDCDGPRRALTVEVREGRLGVFLPPLLQEAWTALLEAVDASLPAGLACDFSGYVPDDFGNLWHDVVLAADPGVLEINVPPCATWGEYDGWLRKFEDAQETVGLRTWKEVPPAAGEGTGGGHHLLFGGATLERNPFFRRPGWVVSILRFWQHHPSLSFLFTGRYAGPSSQAPRADESAKSLWDLEMAYSWLQSLPDGVDHREAIAGTLVHLHSDTSGNTHRSEISFDKFWNTRFPGGARGLIEFRALESLPQASWASAVALLWRSLAAHLLARPCCEPLRDFGDSLHDRFFLPTPLWDDFLEVLQILEQGGFELDAEVFERIRDWRFPVLLETGSGLVVRRALEGWPLLCETPLEGGSTSRFVDTSMERLEFSAPEGFVERCVVRVNGRELPFCATAGGRVLTGLRCRRSALTPSLHPGVPVQFPLVLEIEEGRRTQRYVLGNSADKFRRLPASTPPPPRGAPCRRASASHVCHDLRLPGLETTMP